MGEVSPIVDEPKIELRVEPINKFAEFLWDISRKWSRKWKEAKAFEPKPDPEKPKFFTTAAFPYPNGPLHLGHLRVYTITDVIARYKRVKGYNVLFPMGFHYTGTPVLVMSEKIASGDKVEISRMRSYGVPEDVIPQLSTPIGMARYFHSLAKYSMDIAGYSIDWRREFTTIDPEFSKFIVWQFTKLKKKGYLVKGSHPVGWCPVHHIPVGMHDTKGDVEPEIGEFTLIHFRDDEGNLYPAATLRPETVFGVTNVWVNPDAEYVLAEVDGQKWIISAKSAFKLGFQNRHVVVLKKFKGAELAGKELENPITGYKVPVIPASFVDENTATGIVMSVPAHAPFDYAALKDVKRSGLLQKLGIREIEPIPLIRVEGYSEIPAKDAVESRQIKSQEEREKLDEATKEIYAAEHSHGVMREDIDRLVNPELLSGHQGTLYAGFLKEWIAGKPVAQARENIKKLLQASGNGDKMYEILNKPVYCRCGNEIVVKVLEDQWFIDYGNKEWKKLAHKALELMKILPEEYRSQFRYTIDWLTKKACARTRGLGTELPWAPGWIIESLSDSTIYMAFYTVNYRIKRLGVDPSRLDVDFWEYIFLGNGDPEKISEKTGIPRDELEAMRSEFDYWYPLDARHSGKDLVQNHLTFFIFNHVALFPEEKWPRSIAVNGFVMVEGSKMSKSLGNVLALIRVARVYGPDGARAATILASEMGQDANFTVELFKSTLSQLSQIYNKLNNIISSLDGVKPGKPNTLHLLDRWMLSRLSTHIEETAKAIDNFRLRDAANRVFYMLDSDFSLYTRLTANRDDEARKYVLYKVADSWIRMLQPFTPYLAEELWEKLGGEDLVSHAEWPETPPRDIEAEIKMAYATLVAEDIRSIIKVAGKGTGKAVLVFARSDMLPLLREAIHIIREGRPVRDLIRKLATTYSMGREAPKLAKRLYQVASDLPPMIRDFVLEAELDEAGTVEELKHYIEDKTGLKIEISTQPPEGMKEKMPLPTKPAIYVI